VIDSYQANGLATQTVVNEYANCSDCPPTPTPPGLYYTYNSCDPSYGAVSVFLSTPPPQTADRRYRISSNSYFVYDGNVGTTTPFNAVETLQFTGQAGCI
jgi:hypothetical protein